MVLSVTTLILNETLTGSDEFFIYSLTIFILHDHIIIGSIAIQSNSLHRPAKHLYHYTGITGKNSICMKTNYEDLYSRLICGPRYGPRLAHDWCHYTLVIFNTDRFYLLLYLFQYNLVYITVNDISLMNDNGRGLHIKKTKQNRLNDWYSQKSSRKKHGTTNVIDDHNVSNCVTSASMFLVQ
ncbi:hypothetical protein DERF_012429 [Dermatophagoides farinae]|uniref:Uncharacterized protein n=1 Tax=Dermatophagoides farinae TaxID=6954 RepID=A0A922HS00_DERFA|nr:hypothetical protein DERF_012429 [Dermatophagoides farinae]